MADNTAIEWTDATWNPVTGCSKVSPGCDHCYAETFAERWRGKPGHYFERGFDVVLRPDKLDQPIRWTKPRRIFVNSMSDLFHDAIPDEFIARVFAVISVTQRHTFQLLTKRHGRMRSLLSSPDFHRLVADIAPIYGAGNPDLAQDFVTSNWPLPNLWLGVSVEDQKWANLRIPALLDTPAAVRWLSCEPLLGPVDLNMHLPVAKWDDRHPRINWVVAGGESGRGARPMHPAWARSLRDQCTASGVSYLFKQWGEWVPPSQMPADTFMSWDIANGGSAYDRDQPWRTGKKAAGRELDGRTWDEYPAGRVAVAS